ncbi:MAG: aminotransferase class III-fold pyridoxal phosphate-dependent enzyme [Proteobacteria bacterium]|nr:aminotransferase class III-fold pyridoxal phosphate-dependent enzyme [Pseudomonadota bacterium]
MSLLVERYWAMFAHDRELAEAARKYMPDGVSTDSRILIPFPIYVDQASGSRKVTMAGHELIDYWAGHGALLLGHGAPAVTRAVARQLARGTHFAACHNLAVDWAHAVTRLVPGADQVRFTASGTEAVLLAIELACAHTGKTGVLRFSGHYHGWHGSIHCDDETSQDRVVVCRSHDIAAAADCLRADSDIACIIVEPTGPCSGVVPYDGAFIRELRALSAAHGVLLIFDEVVTGFRVAPGGAQELFGVVPDLTTLAKVLCGGLPGGAVAGRREFLAPLRKQNTSVTSHRPPIAHMGTFSGNPLSAAAGVAMLREVATKGLHERLDSFAGKLRKRLNQVIDQHRLDWVVYGTSSCIKFLIGHGQRGLNTGDFDPRACAPAVLLGRGDAELIRGLRLAMLVHGVDIAPSSFVTSAHTEKDIDETAAALDASIELLRRDGLIR